MGYANGLSSSRRWHGTCSKMDLFRVASLQRSRTFPQVEKKKEETTGAGEDCSSVESGVWPLARLAVNVRSRSEAQ